MTVSRVQRRLLPLLLAMFVACYVDRVNVGFAALQMNRALGLSAAAYGLGAGVFFLGYALLEIPSNLALARLGARVWIARIMISWGVISSATLLARGAPSFYALRFLLGAAEAGFFPGIIFYLGQWFPDRARARVIALFMVALPVAGIVSGPASGVLLGLSGTLGLQGWQWLFLVEGIPSVALGVVALIYLTDRPEQARWLDPAQRVWLAETLR
ncbi:MAG TPA: MFS transporter, partial [Longimicrobiales bacterium]